jgi:histidinol-phosphate aminotransferase
MLRVKEAVLKVKEYHPPLGGRAGMRLDFNENTAGCSPRVLARVRRLDLEELAKYPEREPVERQLAERFGVRTGQLLLTNGVDEAIHLLCQAYLEAADEMLLPEPTYAMYEIYAAGAGGKTIGVPAGPEFEFPAEALAARIGPRTRMLAIASPNNPTGAVAEAGAVLELAKAAPQAAVLVDEAYFEFYGRTLLGEVGQVPNLFVARTFSKAYGLAGLRAGVLVGPAEQMQMLRRLASPYNVNAAALACLPEALADQEYIANYTAEVRRGRDRLQCELAALGFKFWPSQANFILFLAGEKRLPLIEAMRRRGILIRDRHRDPGCAGCVRITVGTGAQTEAAIEALRAAVNS